MTRYVEISLTPAEMMLCAHAGIMRRIENYKKGAVGKYNFPANAPLWQIDIEGCIGEYVVSKYLNIFWLGKGTQKAPDLSNGDEVRISDTHTNRLILHKDDRDDARYWFVTGANGTYRIHGWVYGLDGKDARYWADPHGGRAAYFIPTEALIAPDWKG